MSKNNVNSAGFEPTTFGNHTKAGIRRATLAPQVQSASFVDLILYIDITSLNPRKTCESSLLPLGKSL